MYVRVCTWMYEWMFASRVHMDVRTARRVHMDVHMDMFASRMHKEHKTKQRTSSTHEHMVPTLADQHSC